MVLNQLVDQQHLLLDLPHQPLELDLLLDLERRVHIIYIYIYLERCVFILTYMSLSIIVKVAAVNEIT